jgi:2-polyprenyl-3-methyl-5-hydroxy-6-metoxy-1,4-benzoquinol methylase
MIECKVKTIEDWCEDLTQGRKVLDVGSMGPGPEYPSRLFDLMRSASKSIVGIDSNPECKIYSDDIRCYNAEDFDLGEEFAIAISISTLEHVNNAGKVIENMAKHAPLVAISTPNPFGIYQLRSVLLSGKNCQHPDHTAWLCEKSLIRLGLRHNLCPISITPLVSEKNACLTMPIVKLRSVYCSAWGVLFFNYFGRR